MIIGFNFTKIAVDKKGPVKGKVEIKRDLSIKDIKEEAMQSKKPAIRVSFEFSVTYDPKIASIIMNGELFYLTDKAKSIAAEWKKSKKLDDDKITFDVVNVILARCNIRSLQLSDDMNLPPTIRLPKVKAKEDSSYAAE